jgi:hypothetical protein
MRYVIGSNDLAARIHRTHAALCDELWSAAAPAGQPRAVPARVAPDPRPQFPYALALVGGADHASLALRRAQACVRHDGQPSLWSHALLLGLPEGRSLREAVGLECALTPDRGEEQVPESNGITWTRFSRYLSSKLYPNLAILRLRIAEGTSSEDPAERRKRLEDAARNPLAAADRFPCWKQLGAWKQYVHEEHGTTSPLLRGVAMPCAAWIEYLFESMGIDLFPGGGASNACPELLYASLKHYRGALAEFGVEFELDWVLKDESCKRREGRDRLPAEEWSTRFLG